MRSHSRRDWTAHHEPPMRVCEEILELCRSEIDPPWKRRIRNVIHPFRVWKFGVHAAGEGAHFGQHSGVQGAWLGNFCSFGPRAAFNGPVVIGDLSMLSSEVQVIGQDHVFSDPSRAMRLEVPTAPRPVTVIEADCWIGSRVTLMEGVRIGRGSIVGAASVVTKSIPPYSIAVGVPARVIAVRFDAEQAKSHDELLYKEARPIKPIMIDQTGSAT